MTLQRSEHIRPLKLVHLRTVEFIQVLVADFKLDTQRQGTTLDLHFGDDSLTVASVAGKDALRHWMRDIMDRAPAYQAQIDDCLAGPPPKFLQSDPDFPFRYASGGVLPILRLGDHDYYVLNFREIFPIGWNIANGGAESIKELLEPQRIVDREFREELLIANPKAGRLYAFPHPPDAWEEGAWRVARALWHDVAGMWQEESEEEPEELPMKWVTGPDSVRVTYKGQTVRSDGFFLNINTHDFGIEVDRVARMRLEDDVRIFDGELEYGVLIGAPIGLFETQRTNHLIDSGETCFVPDRLFFDGRPRDPRELEHVVHHEFLPRMEPHLSKEQMGDFARTANRLDLCPVTRRIIWRYFEWEEGIAPLKPPVREPIRGRPPYDVFLSFKHEDAGLASKVYEYLSGMNLAVFFSQESLPVAGTSEYSRAIDNALDQAKCLVVVATRLEHLEARWVHYEWKGFQIDILNGRKPAGRLFSVISGFDSKDLPRGLTINEAIEIDPSNPQPALSRLHTFLHSALTSTD